MAISSPALSAPRRFPRAAAAHLFTLAFLLAWELAALATPAFLLPGPWEVARTAAGFLGEAKNLRHLALSIGHVLVAILVSFLIGGGLAVLAHYRPLFRFAVHRRIGPFLNAFSGIGWTLLSVMWFGISSVTVVVAITAVLIPFALVNLAAGLASLDREMMEMAASFTRDRRRQFRLAVLPALVPFLFATLRIMFGVAWKVTLTAELFGGNAGLGYVINLARQDFDTATIFVAIILIVAFVYGTDRLLFQPLQAGLTRHYGP